MFTSILNSFSQGDCLLTMTYNEQYNETTLPVHIGCTELEFCHTICNNDCDDENYVIRVMTFEPATLVNTSDFDNVVENVEDPVYYGNYFTYYEKNITIPKGTCIEFCHTVTLELTNGPNGSSRYESLSSTYVGTQDAYDNHFNTEEWEDYFTREKDGYIGGPVESEYIGSNNNFPTVTSAIPSKIVTASTACVYPSTDDSEQSVVIDGTFEIDIDYCFRNSDIAMTPGSEIIVKSGNTLNLRNSTITACSAMWKSITVEDGATLNVSFSTIKDGEYAIKVLDGGTATISNNEFINNYVSVYVPRKPISIFNPPTSSYNNVSFPNFWANTFSGPDKTVEYPVKMKEAYNGQSTSLGSYPYAGIFLNDVSGVSIGHLTSHQVSPNVFMNLANGIIARNSSMSLGNMTMSKIQEDRAYNISDIGVWAGNSAGHHSSNYSPYNYIISTHEYSNISDCNYGFKLSNMNIDIENIEINNSNFGISSEMGKYNINILNNSMTNVNRCITLSENNGSTINLGQNVLNDVRVYGINANSNIGTHSISNNNIVMNPNFSTFAQGETTYGIICTDMEGTVHSAKWDISDNFITGTNCLSGIFCSGNTPSLITNEVQLSGWWSYSGISVANCLQPNLEENIVDMAGANYSAIGIMAAASPSGDYYCNITTNGSIGVLFDGMSQANFQTNRMTGNWWSGLTITFFGRLGAQYHKGNLFANSTWNAMNVHPDPDTRKKSKFTVATPIGDIGYPPNYNPLADPDPSTIMNYNLGDDWWKREYYGNTPSCGEIRDTFPTVDYTDTDDAILNNTLYDPNTEEALSWSAKQYLYSKVTEKNLSNILVPNFEYFRDNLAGPTIRNFYEVEAILKNYYVDNDDIIILIKSNMNTISDLIHNKMILLDNLLDENLSSPENIEINNQIQTIESSIDSLKNSNQQLGVDLDETPYLIQAQNILSNINVSTIHEINWKTVFDIYIRFRLSGDVTFNESDAMQLLDIADQCPALGGNAVYLARNLYNKVQLVYHNDYENCQPSTNYRMASKNRDSDFSDFEFTLAPNPAKNEISISKPFTMEGIITIVNSFGLEVHQQKIHSNQSKIKINLSKFNSGIYFYEIKSKGFKTSNKFVVLK